MNQPSAEELWDIYSGGDNVIHKEQFFEILDRYHLIDKTEPIPGAVSLSDMRKLFFEYDAMQDEGIQEMIDTLDIYPKGTVARLQGEIEELKKPKEMPGSVSAEKIGGELFRMNTGSNREKGETLRKRFDIFPKGTVARLMGEVEELKKANTDRKSVV